MTRLLTIGGYAIFVGGLCALQVLGVRHPEAAPTGGHLLGYPMRSTPGRWLVLLGWCWLGWHLFVR